MGCARGGVLSATRVRAAYPRARLARIFTKSHFEYTSNRPHSKHMRSDTRRFARYVLAVSNTSHSELSNTLVSALSLLPVQDRSRVRRTMWSVFVRPRQASSCMWPAALNARAADGGSCKRMAIRHSWPGISFVSCVFVNCLHPLPQEKLSLHAFHMSRLGLLAWVGRGWAGVGRADLDCVH